MIEIFSIGVSRKDIRGLLTAAAEDIGEEALAAAVVSLMQRKRLGRERAVWLVKEREGFIERAEEALSVAGVSASEFEKAIEEFSKLLEVGGKVLSWWSEGYPRRLREALSFYPFLTVRGNERILSAPAIAVVGTRRPSPEGRQRAWEIVKEISSAGGVVLSGGAVGIDSEAHTAALEEGGMTAAVVGSGLLRPYPRKNSEIFSEIIRGGGALVSPFHPIAAPERWRFPYRNRVLAVLSVAVVVVQAPAKSGALITAHAAAEEGRPVFVLRPVGPGAEWDGNRKLIAEGATPIERAEEIFERLGLDTEGGAGFPLLVDEHVAADCGKPVQSGVEGMFSVV